MSKAWVRRSGLVAVSLMTVGMLAGCSPDAAPLPLTLYAEPVPAYLNEEIVVALGNPTKSRLFVPAAWTGLAVYRKKVSESWEEYFYPDGFQPMLTTTEPRVEYSIPAGALESGNYKLVLQGRIGIEGTPFSLEINLYISHVPVAEAGQELEYQ